MPLDKDDPRYDISDTHGWGGVLRRDLQEDQDSSKHEQERDISDVKGWGGADRR